MPAELVSRLSLQKRHTPLSQSKECLSLDALAFLTKVARGNSGGQVCAARAAGMDRSFGFKWLVALHQDERSSVSIIIRRLALFFSSLHLSHIDNFNTLCFVSIITYLLWTSSSRCSSHRRSSPKTQSLPCSVANDTTTRDNKRHVYLLCTGIETYIKTA